MSARTTRTTYTVVVHVVDAGGDRSCTATHGHFQSRERAEAVAERYRAVVREHLSNRVGVSYAGVWVSDILPSTNAALEDWINR